MFKTISVLLLAVALVNARNINQAGLDLIKVSEGFRANFYGDPVGIRTIGYGHNCKAKGCDTIHAPITQAQGEALLHQDLVGFQNCVEKAVPFVNDNQFAALVSFSFNLGCGALEGSTLLKDVKAKNYSAAANEFGKWVHAGGKVLPGLVKRRAAEKALFLKILSSDSVIQLCISTMHKIISVLLLAVAFVNARDINQAGLDLIKGFEHFEPNFYNDGVDKITIGYGHNCEALGCSGIEAPISKATAEDILQKDLVQFKNCVQKAVPFVNDNQFAALVSLTFNIGCANFGESTLLKDLKAKNYSAAANEFASWRMGTVKGKKQVLNGLVTRRAAEKALFLK
ncbi:unnamed protein product [Oppiella nova]|uniref:Lysozyme n=1 Tax=Oppiella nova TaxID=334625 RepID=A0A7R9QUH5_9ACAR|nr:unnamed protein product [Oppiella nova]CAG2174510.1 unnamed protein product [Oppiella nova]